MSHVPQKTSAANLVEEANAYGIIGIDKAQCNMPLIDPQGNMGRGSMVTDQTSVGHFIFKKLQPALEQLATAIVLEQNASFFDSNLIGAKQQVANDLATLAIQSRHSADKAGVTGLMEKLNGVAPIDLPETMDTITDEIVAKLTEKARVAAAAGKKR